MRSFAIAALSPAAAALSLTLAASAAGAQTTGALRPCAAVSGGVAASNTFALYGFREMTLDVQKGLVRALDREDIVFRGLFVEAEEAKQTPSKPLGAIKQTRCRLLIEVQGIIDSKIDVRFDLAVWPAELDAVNSVVLGRQPSFKKSYTAPKDVSFDFKNVGEDMSKDLAAAGLLAPIRGAAIDPARIRADYDRAVAHLTATPEVHLRNILVDTEAAAQVVLQRLREGAAFDKLARELSQDQITKAQGGDMGWHVATTLGPDIAQEVSALGAKNGLFARPVKTDHGWHAIEMVGQRPQKIPAFEQVQRHVALKLRWQDMEAAAARSGGS